MQRQSREIGLRTMLGVLSVVIIATGVNVGFGGIATLGLQGPTDFFAVTNTTAFVTQDSHVRFLGGTWLGIGLLFAAATVRLNALRPVVCAAFVLIIVGALARTSGGGIEVLLGQGVGLSFAAELFLMPLLLWRAYRGGARARAVNSTATS